MGIVTIGFGLVLLTWVARLWQVYAAFRADVGGWATISGAGINRPTDLEVEPGPPQALGFCLSLIHVRHRTRPRRIAGGQMGEPEPRRL